MFFPLLLLLVVLYLLDNKTVLSKALGSNLNTIYALKTLSHTHTQRTRRALEYFADFRFFFHFHFDLIRLSAHFHRSVSGWWLQLTEHTYRYIYTGAIFSHEFSKSFFFVLFLFSWLCEFVWFRPFYLFWSTLLWQCSKCNCIQCCFCCCNCCYCC